MTDRFYSPLSKVSLLLWLLFWTFSQTILIHRFQWSWEVAFADAVVTNIIIAIAIFSTVTALKSYQAGAQNRIYRFAWGVSLSIASVWLVCHILSYLFAENESYLNFINLSYGIRWGYAMLMISFAALVSWMKNFIEDKDASEVRKKDAEKLVRDAELSGLRQQLQPHFLFNSLNSISALAGSKPIEARKMIQQLSEFLRGTLHSDVHQFIPLAEELKHLELYLDIEKVRFGHRLQTQINVPEECGGKIVPALILQPLVENAIKFGLYDTLGDVCIQIEATCTDNNLQISVSNPFDPGTAGAMKGTGFGLASVGRRMFLLFSRHDLLNSSANENLFITTLTIPQSA
jgi:sensor histidine kinase YesM